MEIFRPFAFNVVKVEFKSAILPIAFHLLHLLFMLFYVWCSFILIEYFFELHFISSLA